MEILIVSSPNTGLQVAYDANDAYTLSFTALTLQLTAGHCVEPPAFSAEIWFDADVENGIPENGYPNTGEVHSDMLYLHPLYNPSAFFLNDVGVVVLKPQPNGKGPRRLSKPTQDTVSYPVLPELKQLDGLRQHDEFTAVGYGLQEINPVFVEAARVRMVAHPTLIQVNTPGFTGDFSLLLSNNHATGGTCFGDSGGPNFLGDSNVIAGVTSFGINGNCAGTGLVYRLDGEDDLAWLNTFLAGE
jgi:hypothetical protein